MLLALVTALAALGALALLARLVRALLRLALAAAEATHARALADLSARRGDVTAMAERRESARTARRQGMWQGAWAALWLVLLLTPSAAGMAREVWAAAAVLWLFPGRTPRGVRRLS